MAACTKNLLILTQKFNSSPFGLVKIKNCDKILVQTCFHISRQQQQQHSSSSSSSSSNFVDSRDKLTLILRKKVDLLNLYYERFFGIAEVRQMQGKVLEVENDFIKTTKERRSCQDKIDSLKENISELREKLDTLPRSSDSYLNLITSEHKLLRELIVLENQLKQAKEREQYALDSFSTLLRQSHELERLRHDRAKYWQIISIFVTSLGYTIAFIRQKSKSQKCIHESISLVHEDITKVNQLQDKMATKLASVENNSNYLIQLLNKLVGLTQAARKSNEQQTKKQDETSSSYLSYSYWLSIPVVGYLMLMFTR